MMITYEVIYVLIATLKIVSGFDLCEEHNLPISSFVHQQSVPAAGPSAGNFYVSNGVNTLDGCLLSCCGRLDCDVLLFKDNDCYLIQCNKTNPSGCLPVQTGIKFQNTTMIMVRTVQPIAVSAGNNVEVNLPTNSTTLTAFTVPEDDQHVYKYSWSLLLHPEETGQGGFGEMNGINSAELKLSGLIAGLYTFRVEVTADGLYGEAKVNVTVKPVTRENSPPEAIIQPKEQEVKSNNDVVLDGSNSKDDLQIVSYKWALVKGPMSVGDIPEQDTTKQILQLHQLPPGEYNFKLTVTDSDGATNSTTATVNVIKETDYPPKANAGSNEVIYLPKNSLDLYGNASTDDHGIVEYEWIKLGSDKLTADMTGVRTAHLHLENLVAGDYKFQLKVTDVAGQSDADNVTVFVKLGENNPPVAFVGPQRNIITTENLILDGSNSSDDKGIEKYSWVQASGPSVAIENSDRPVATVTKLTPGEYKFRLTVTDNEGQTGEAVLLVNVTENVNLPPRANAGLDQQFYLPVTLVQLDGRQSTDDHGIVSYLWAPSTDSLAAGVVVNDSDHKPVLLLTQLVAGRYTYTLTVKDMDGLTSSSATHIDVQPSSHFKDLVEIHLQADIHSFTQANKQQLLNGLQILLHKERDLDVFVHIEDILPLRTSSGLLVTFYVTCKTSGSSVGHEQVWRGTDVARALKKRLKDQDVLDFDVLFVDTVVCQSNCSGHGHCDQGSKLCVCDAFWMQNFFKSYFNAHETNCDWSVLYVIIVGFISLVVLMAAIWALVIVCRRLCRNQRKKRHRYSLLEDMSDDKDSLELTPKGKIQRNSIMLSESEETSEEETLFINKKLKNGQPKNGLKKGRTKVRT